MKIFRRLKNLFEIASDWWEFAGELPERIHYMEQSHMSLQDSVAKLEQVDEQVAAAVGTLRQEISNLRNENTGELSQAEQSILADRIEATINAIGNALTGTVTAEPVVENGEVVGGVLADDAENFDGVIGHQPQSDEAIASDGNELTIGDPIPVADEVATEYAAPVAGLNDETISVSEENRHPANPADQV